MSHPLPGFIYDVDEAFGQQLIAMHVAIEVRSIDPAIAPEDDLDRVARGVVVIPPDKASG